MTTMTTMTTVTTNTIATAKTIRSIELAITNVTKLKSLVGTKSSSTVLAPLALLWGRALGWTYPSDLDSTPAGRLAGRRIRHLCRLLEVNLI